MEGQEGRDAPELISVAELAKLLQRHPRTIYTRIARGDYDEAVVYFGRRVVLVRALVFQNWDGQYLAPRPKRRRPVPRRSTRRVEQKKPTTSPSALAPEWLARFATRVLEAANRCKVGRFDNKVLISCALKELSGTTPLSKSDLATAKQWLVDAHNARLLFLEHAEWFHPELREEFVASETTYRSFRWHYVWLANPF